MNDQKRDRKKNEPRKPYEKPAILSEEVFETLALSCARQSPFTCSMAVDRS
jgi:hypothetical protein